MGLSPLVTIGDGAIDLGEPILGDLYPGDVVTMSVCGGLLVFVDFG